MKTPIKSYLICLRELSKHPSNFFFVLYSYIKYFVWIPTKPLHIIPKDFDINKTLIRWWDGETMAALTIPFVFSYDYEKANKQLSIQLLNLLEQSLKQKDIQFAIGTKYYIYPEKQTENLRCYILSRRLLQKYIQKSSIITEQLFFRNIGSYDKFQNLYKDFNILLVTNQQTIKKVKAHWKLNIIESYAIPSKNSFDQLDTIKQSLDKILKTNNGISKNKTRTLISGWPTGKLIALYLHQKHNIISHDVGAVFDIYLKQTL